MSDPISAAPPGIPRSTRRETTIDDLLTEYPIGLEPPKSTAIDEYLSAAEGTGSTNGIDQYLNTNKPPTGTTTPPLTGVDQYLNTNKPPTGPTTPPLTGVDQYLNTNKPPTGPTAPPLTGVDQYLNTNKPGTTTRTGDAIDEYLSKPPASSTRTGSALDQYLATGMAPSNSSLNQLALRDKFIAKLGLQPQADGSFTRAGDTSKYHFQPNGTFFRSAGEITLPNGTKQAQTAATLSLDGDTIKESADTILPWTMGIASLRLTQNADGSYRRQGDNGRYLLQPDGTIFYEGSEKAKPQTYDPTKPQGSRFDTARRTPIPGTLAALNIGLVPKTKDTFVLPAADGTLTLGEYTIKPNGDVHWSGGKDSTGRIFPPLIGRFNSTTNTTTWFAVVDGKEYPLQTSENTDKTIKYFIDDGTVKKTFNPSTGVWDNS